MKKRVVEYTDLTLVSSYEKDPVEDKWARRVGINESTSDWLDVACKNLVKETRHAVVTKQLGLLIPEHRLLRHRVHRRIASGT